MKRHAKLTLMLIAAMLLVPVATLQAQVEITDAAAPPDSPDAAMQAIAQGLGNAQPIHIWRGLPQSYQTDVTAIVHKYGQSVDPEVHNKIFTVLTNINTVLTDKRQFLLNGAVAEGSDPEELSAQFDAVSGLISAITTSELNSVDAVKELDIPAFLNTGGANIVEQFLALAKTSSPEEAAEIEAFKTVTVQTVTTEGDTAVVRMTDGDEEVDEIQMIRVEGRWIPKDMAEGWAEGVAEIKEGLDSISSPENKAATMQMLNSIDSMIANVNNAQTQEQFDQAFIGAMMSLMFMFQ